MLFVMSLLSKCLCVCVGGDGQQHMLSATEVKKV